jgi:hypothetical protein
MMGKAFGMTFGMAFGLVLLPVLLAGPGLAGPGLAGPALAGPALAGPAADAVGWFYDGLPDPYAPEARDRFAGQARRVLDAAEAAEAAGRDCTGFAFVTDARTGEVAGLALAEVPLAEGAIVTATFTAGGEDAILDWFMRAEGGAWRVEDVASRTRGWVLGNMGCG